MVAASGDPQGGMVFYIFFWLDYPVSRSFMFASGGSGGGSMFFLGGLLWFSYGWVFQSLLQLRTQHGAWWLDGAVSLLTAVLFVPELTLASMPDWEEQWERGTAAVQAGDRLKGIEHVSKAIELSPSGNQSLSGMWDYLGRLHVDAENYGAAEAAFRMVLGQVETGQTSRPIDHLNAHNQLSWLYNRMEKYEGEKTHLEKAIEFNRLVYEGDSTQEAHCWARLAEIEFKRGKTEEALRLLDKAINMEEGLTHPSEFLLSYRKEMRLKWSEASGKKN
ncbi:tetratricopeptide repeat protein [Roseimicrobium gellanilyticum]|uniref:tetratricopeptide repeat protein n=1 Tax=Roseimicrobium gellanilyticum TaxID=748857 RepID=UPI0014763C92|nr:tetratricopeptide repeat protein [Roseimicrobium gellanilyticum]